MLKCTTATAAPAYLSHMGMNDTMIAMSFLIAILIAGFAGYLFWAQRKFGELESAHLATQERLKLKIGAYERLTLFTERTKLSELITRLFTRDMSAHEMRVQLVSAIKEEFAHNVTQQLYVHPEVWEAVVRMKEQNIYIINHVANLLPPDSSAHDLNRQLLELTSAAQNSTLNHVVLQAIQHEVKELMA